MKIDLYNDFLNSNDTLRIFCGDTLVFSSSKERLVPLMEYIASGVGNGKSVTVFDKVMGNAAALLSVKVSAGDVFSPLGSELAIETLDKYGITHHLDAKVPFILRADGVRMCPMEELSIGKTPDEFYTALKARMKAAGTDGSC
jgi:hypothetical protein